jgi:hypothetical protein
MMFEREWDDVTAELRGRSGVPAAQAVAGLLDAVRAGWVGQVVLRTSMHDLLFTVPGDEYPFAQDVRVSWGDGLFTMTLAERGVVRTADRCRDGLAATVLDAFLRQLVGDDLDG